jgi:hypothetical protein
LMFPRFGGQSDYVARNDASPRGTAASTFRPRRRSARRSRRGPPRRPRRTRGPHRPSPRRPTGRSRRTLRPPCSRRAIRRPSRSNAAAACSRAIRNSREPG